MSLRMLLLLSVFMVTGAQAAFDPLRIGDDEVFGPNPQLAKPQSGWLPTVKIADPIGWKTGEKPVAPAGLTVTEFASGLDHPRWLYVMPDGSVLVAESNAPPKETGGIKSWIMSLMMSKAGAGVPSANRITRLADTDGDGIADRKSVFLDNLFSPFGMALIGDTFYVANADAIVAHAIDKTNMTAQAPARIITELPGGPRNHHWTKNIIASKDGTKLYVTVGSNSNVGENGMEEEKGRAAVWEVPLDGKAARVFASGLRNPNGLDFEPGTGALWTVVNERDEIGDNLVPDYLTEVKDGAFYGWPFTYFGMHADTRAPKPAPPPEAVMPDYALGAHTASLGLAFSDGKTLGPDYAEGAFIGQHGSWNRSTPAGYRVVFVPFRDGKPAGKPSVVLGGFLNEDGSAARGRPVGVVRDGKGGLLVADDVGNKIWRITQQAPQP
jgi:glucose/arabinose dehydrogenase